MMLLHYDKNEMMVNFKSGDLSDDVFLTVTGILGLKEENSKYIVAIFYLKET